MTSFHLDDSVAKSVNRFLIGDLVFSTSLEECKGGCFGEFRESYARWMTSSMSSSGICNRLSFPRD
jgi:hypothetical protein